MEGIGSSSSSSSPVCAATGGICAVTGGIALAVDGGPSAALLDGNGSGGGGNEFCASGRLNVGVGAACNSIACCEDCASWGVWVGGVGVGATSTCMCTTIGSCAVYEPVFLPASGGCRGVFEVFDSSTCGVSLSATSGSMTGSSRTLRPTRLRVSTSSSPSSARKRDSVSTCGRDRTSGGTRGCNNSSAKSPYN